MPKRFISEDPETARQKLLQACQKNQIATEYGLAASDALLIQFDNDDRLAIRKRDCAGKGTCPAVLITLSKHGRGSQVEEKSTLASTGKTALAGAIILSGGLLVSSLLALSFSLLNPYSWLIYLSSLTTLSCIWLRVIQARKSLEQATRQFLKTVWTDDLYTQRIAESKLVIKPKEISDNTQKLPASWQSPSAAISAPLPYGPSASQDLPFQLPDMPVEGIPMEWKLRCPTSDVMRKFEHYAQSRDINFSGSLGFNRKPYFDIKLRDDGITIFRIRPTNSWLFKLLITHTIDLDLAPRVNVKIVADESGGSRLLISSKTTIFRKLLSVIMYTISFPGIAFVILGALLLIPGLIVGNDKLALPGLFLFLFFGGGVWATAELRGSDKTEYAELMLQLGEMLGDLPTANK